MRMIGTGILVVMLVTSGLALGGPQTPTLSLPGIPNPKVAREAPEIGRSGGTYVVSTVSDPRTFNPTIITDTATGDVLSPIFAGLVEQNYLSGEIEPALAEGWTLSPDGRTWTFTLREGVRWSDGELLTTNDVAFTLEAIFTEGLANSARDSLTFKGKPIRWHKVDDRHIQFISEQPLGFFLRLIGFNIIPKHKLQLALAKGAATFTATWGVNTPPREIVGTGPFVMQSYTPGQRVTYLRNPLYWKVDRAGNRLPYLTRYVRLIVPNQDAVRLKFLANETDIYSARPREFAEFKQGEKAGNYTVYDGPETFSAEYVVFNQNPRGITPPKLAWFQDVKFRRALNHAIDRTTIAQQIYAGRATPAWGPVSVSNPLFYNPRLPAYPYDLTRASQLLEEAGYRKGPDGFLRDPGGNIIDFVLSTNAGNLDREAMGNILRQDFAKLGLKITFAPEAFQSLITKLDASFKWDAIIIGVTGGIEPGTGRNVWLSSGNLHDWNPRQERPTTEWEAEIDRIFEQVAVEVDQAKRKQLYFRWQEIVATQVPLMYFTNPKTQPAIRNTLGNIKLGLQGVVGRLEWLYYKTAYR